MNRLWLVMEAFERAVHRPGPQSHRALVGDLSVWWEWDFVPAGAEHSSYGFGA
jgi:hypothetical protein